MIDPQTVRNILDAARIEEVVGDFVALKKRGKNYWGVCPFHHEKTPSFSVTPSKGIFYCFGCQKGGNSATFMMMKENMDFPEALRYLAKKYHIEIVERYVSDEEKQREEQARLEREKFYLANDFATKFFTETLHNTEEGRAIGLTYFRERGFTDEIIKKFQLGYAPDNWTKLTEAAQKAGYDISQFVQTSLCKENEQKHSYYDFFRDRVIFPWFTITGKVVAFTGRLLTKETKGVSQKYLNTAETPIFKKSDQLFGFFQAKKAIEKSDNAFIVEGQTDVISMHQCGIENVVACSGGIGMSKTQARLLRKFAKNVTLMYDCDAAGERYTDTAIIAALTEGMHASVVRLPEGEDPDSFARKHNADEFIDYIEKNRIDFVTYMCEKIVRNSANDPVKCSKMINEELIPALMLVFDNILLNNYLKIASKKLEMSDRVLLKEIKRKRWEKIEREKAKKSDETEQIPPYEPSDIPPEFPVENVPEIVVEAPQKFLFDAEEKNILYFLVRYANEVLCEETTENGTVAERVGKYILSELKNDNIVFQNPLYQKILTEVQIIIEHGKVDPQHYFVNHPNLKISELAANLMTDKYQLSKCFQTFLLDETKRDEQNKKELHEWLLNAVPRVVLELKLKIVERNIELARERLRTDLSEEAFAQFQQQIECKKAISIILGERVVTK